MDRFVTRRSFFSLLLKGLLFVLFVPPFFPLRMFGKRGRDGLLTSARRLSGIFNNRASARAIGRRYLSAYPQEADLNLLVSRLSLSDLGLQNQKDFAEGRTVVVDGWILGLTEARLCGLTTFT